MLQPVKTAGFRSLTVFNFTDKHLNFSTLHHQKPDKRFGNNLQKHCRWFQSTFLRKGDSIGNFPLHHVGHVFSQASLVPQVLFCDSGKFHSCNYLLFYKTITQSCRRLLAIPQFFHYQNPSSP